MTKKSQKRKPLISALEPRVLFDGAAVATAVDVLDNTSFTNDNNTTDTVDAPATQPLERDRKEVAFVDTTVEDYQTLVDGINEGVEVHLIDGLEDISTILQNESDVDAIHILSHGSTGQINVGNDVLSTESFDTYNIVLQDIKNSLSESGDILLYGCNVASDGSGQEFVDTLASITSADVAASSDITGNSALNGDWDLEVESGSIETDEIVVREYEFSLGEVIIGDGNSSNASERYQFLPTNFSSAKVQILLTASEISSAGLSSGDDITSVQWYVNVDNTSSDVIYDLYMGHTTATTLSSDKTFDTTTSLTLVGDDLKDIGSFSGWHGDTLDTSFVWDGTSSILIQVYRSGDTQSADSIAYDSTTNYSMISGYNSKTLEATTGDYSNNFKPQIKLVTTSNIAPTISGAPADITVSEDVETNVDLSGVTIADTDSLTVTLTASAGTFSAPADGSGVGSGVIETLVNDTTITLAGSAADINTYLDTTTNIKYTSAANPTATGATITLKVADASENNSESVNINVVNLHINEAPVFSTSDTFTINENVAVVGTVTASDTKTNAAIDIVDTDGDTVVDNKITITDMPYFSDMNWTEELWIKPDSDTGLRGIIGGGNPAVAEERIMALFQNDKKLIVNVGDGSDVESFQTSNDVLNINEWNHIALTADGNQYTLYVNGEVVLQELINITQMDQSNNFYIGAFRNQFDGEINDVRIWDDARTQSEIQDNMNKELVGDEANLVAYYKLNETSGTAITDSTGTTSTATLTNSVATATQDGDIIEYSVSGGTDAAKFQIDSSTGELSFIDVADADYETSPTYEVIVTATDKTSGLSSTQTITVNLNDVNDPVTVTNDTVTLEEGETKTGNVLDNDFDSDRLNDDGIEINTNNANEQYLRVGDIDNPTDLFSDATNIDMTMTFKSFVTSGYGTATLFSYAASDNNHFFILVDENSNLTFTFGTGSQASAGITATEIMDGNEHTLRFKYDVITNNYEFILDGVSKSTGTKTTTEPLINTGIILFGQESDKYAKDLALTSAQDFNGRFKNITIDVTTASTTKSVDWDLTDSTDAADSIFTSNGYDLEVVWDNGGNPQLSEIVLSAIRTGTVSGGSTGETSGTLGQTLTGAYGTLTINEDGSYTYVETADLTVAQEVTDSFTYTITSDGVTSEGQLDFEITGTSTPINKAPVFSTTSFSGIAENTTTVGTVSASDIITNPSVDFAGSGDIADTSGINLSGKDITIEGWFSFNDLTSQQNFLRLEDSNDIDIRLIPYKRSTNEIAFYINDGTGADVLGSGVTVEADQFYHLAFVYDGTNKTASIYINGQATNVSEVSTRTLDLSAHNNNLTIASGANASSFNSNVNVNDVRIWNEVRTLSEIQTYMNNELNGTESNLVAYYKMDETSGTTLANSTSNNYDLTISGSGTNVNATQDGDSITYSIVSGELDASRFTINQTTGELEFASAALADYEASNNGVFEVKVRALDSESGLYTDQVITVNVVDDGLADSDGDGVEDIRDIDDDNDGILDIYETGEDFKWATYSLFRGNIANGDIGGTGFTYELTRTNGSALSIQTTTSMYNHIQFPTTYEVPNSTSIKNTVASMNTLTFDETILNPMLAFSSIGNSSKVVPIQFYDDVEILWARTLNGTGTTDGDGDGDGDYTYDSATKLLTVGAEGYVIVKLKGEYDSIKFKYNADETYVNFTFGADIRQEIDTDGDGTVDRLDTDSDGDGVLDNVEAQVAGGSGIADPRTLTGYIAPSGNDIDGDGLDDAYDSNTSNAQATASAGIDAIDSNGNDKLDYLVDEPPVLTVGSLGTFNGRDGSSVVVAPNLTLVDVENQNLDGAKVQINNLKSGDTLSFSDTSKIEATYDSDTGVLTLSTISGQTASVADYQAALRTIEFDTTNSDTTDRSFSFTIGSAIPFTNGHFYEAINVPAGITWSDAKAEAEAKSLYGMQGYLATITSAEENAFILSKLPEDGWIGGSDADTEGTWKWVTGPESGQNISYSNWNSGEPNDSGGNEDAIQFYASDDSGTWNDLPDTVRTLNYYIIEYGGMPGESSPVISDTGTLEVVSNIAPTVVASSNPNAIDFDGSSDYLEAGATLLNNMSQFSISFWLNPDTFDFTNNNFISLVGQDNAYELMLDNTDGADKVAFRFYSSTAGTLRYDVTDILNTNTWTHMALTGDSQAGNIKLYVNGNLAETITFTDKTTFGNSDENTSVGGRVQDHTDPDFFDGKMDEISIWNTVKTADEISTLQTARLDGNETGLLAYWTMDEGSGSVVSNKVVGADANTNLTFRSAPTWVSSTLNIVTTYNENDEPAVIAPSITLADENNEISTATVSISSGFVEGDTITFTNDGSTMGNITAIYDASTGVMSLSSAGNTATIAEWENALASLTYHTTNSVVNDGSRTISWVVNDGYDDSTADTSTITITGYGANPLIYGTDTATVDENGTVSLSGFTVSDADSSPLTVSITAQNGELDISRTTGISGYTAATKTLVITGTATDLTNALNSLTYSPDTDYNGLEELEIKASDDGGDSWSDYFVSREGLFYNPTNEHYYEFVAESGLTWEQAKVKAEARTYLGLGGYLATVTSQAENDYIYPKLGGQGWFGASDANQTWTRADGTKFTTSEGYWTWVTGPEAGTLFWTDNTNNTDTSTENTQGVAVNGEYNNWKSGEPNDWGGEEDHAHFLTNGEWNDYRYNNSNIQGYIVEYGGLSTDASSKPEAAKLAITVNPINSNPVLEVTGIDSSPNEEYIENGDAITLASGITLSDSDNTTLKSATVSITGGFTSGDNLSFTNDGSTMGNIQGSYDAITGELTLVSPSLDDSISFDGTDDYIDLGDISEITGAYTMEAMIKISDYNQSWGRIFDIGNGQESDNLILTLQAETGKINFETYAGSGYYSIETDAVVPTGEWVHIAAVNHGDGTASIYFDGVLQTTTKFAHAVAEAVAADNVTRTDSFIGKSNWAADEYFKGEIKEARIWNDARTAIEIYDNMNSQLSATDIADTNLLNYYIATKATSDTIVNAASNSTNATLVNGATVNTAGNGTATVQEWNNALSSIKFNSTSYTPGDSKTISWQVNDGESANNLSNIETTTIDIKELYSEQEVDFAVIDNTIDLSSFSGNYAGQYIDFKISDETTTESLGLITANSASNTAGEVTIVGSAVYLGDGTSAKVIGQVDSTLNGQDGNNLRINFAVDFVNGDFNSSSDSAGLLTSTKGATVSIDGWNIYNGRVDFDTDTIDGLAIPTDTIMPSTTQGSDTNKDSSPITQDKGWEVSLNEDSTGDNSVQMYSKMVTADGYSIVRGPYIYSDSAVSLSNGDSVSFQWKAEGGDDAYDVFGYIVNVNDASDYQILLNKTGADASASTDWATETVEVNSDGEYKFVFVSGSWDATGGKWLGAQLYIDDVKVTQQQSSTGIDYTVLEKVAQKVTYTDTSDLTYQNALGDRTIEISAPKAPIDTTKPIATISSSTTGTTSVVTISYDDVTNNGLTQNELEVDNGSISGFVDNSDGTYTVTLEKTDSTKDMTLKILAGAVENASSKTSEVQSFVITDNIDLTSDANWVKLLYGNQYDYFDDVQSNKEGTDLVGDNDHTLLSTQYNSSTDELAFRVRLESENPDGIFTLLGVDGTGNGAIDFFVGVNIPSNGGTPTVEFYETGNGTNDSPSTSSFKNPISAAGGVVNITAASDGDDIDADGNVDGFVSFKLDASAFVSFANGAGGLTDYTIDDQVNFMLLTATQTNSINGDIGGIDGNSSKIKYSDMGAFKPVTFSGDSSGENKTTFTFDKQEVNDPVVLDSVRAISYVDTDGKDTFSAEGGTLSASDVDKDTTISYGIDGGTVDGTTVTKEGLYGILSVDTATGAYTYTPNSTVMDALSSSSSEEFIFTANDNNPNGTSSVDTTILRINVTAVNDSPLLGGSASTVTFTENGSSVLIDSTITIDDTEGENYNGGYLYIKNTANGQSTDELLITEIGGVTLDGNNVEYAGVVIGTIDSTYNGQDGKDLKINFNTDAYSTQAQAVARAISFYNSSDTVIENARTYQVQVNDGGTPTPKFSTKEATVNVVSINDLPVISLDGTNYEVEKSITLNPDGTLGLTGISLSDLDHTSLTVTLETTNYGLLTITDTVSGGVTAGEILNNGTQIVTITSTIEKINKTLANANGLVYTAGLGNDIITPGLDSLKITAVDADSGQDISTKQVTVLPAVPNALSDNILMQEDTEATVDLEKLVKDINVTTSRSFTLGTGTADVDLNQDGDTSDTDESAGSITAFSGNEITDGGGKLIGYQLTNGKLIIAEGTLDDANPVYKFNYTPDVANWSGTDSFVYQYSSDGVNSLIAEIKIIVNAVNDAPVITPANGLSETIDEDNSLTFTGAKAITLADVDVTGNELLDLNLSVSNGILDLSTTTRITFLEGTDASGSMKLRGTLSDLQNAINNLVYTPNAEYNGSDNLVIKFDDRGNTGAGNVLTDTKTIAITINAVNDAPTIDNASDIEFTYSNGANISSDIVNYVKVSDPDTPTSGLTFKIDRDGIEDGNSDLEDTTSGTYGDLTIDPATGKYTFTPDETYLATLPAGEYTQDFVIDVFDGTTHIQETITMKVTVEGQTTATYTEQDPATLILADTNIQTEESYGGGYIEFEVGSSEASEILSFQKGTTPDTSDGAITIIGNSVYLGDGTNAKVIGQIDGNLNGQDGKNLRVNFSVDFNNGNFNSSNDTVGLLSSTVGEKVNIDGWTVVNDRLDFGTDTVAGLATPVDLLWPNRTYKYDSSNYQSDSGSLIRESYNSYVNQDSTGDNSIMMNSRLTSADGFAVIRGPYIYSDSAVSLEAGDKVSFQWKAQGGSDAYDVFGYIVNVNDDSDYQVLLNETGASARSSTNWATENVTVDSAGEYKFVFVSGTWDATGGRALGAQLYIDDVKVTQANPPSGIGSDVLEKIAQKVTYENTGDLTAANDVQNKTVTVTAHAGNGTEHSDTKVLNIQEVNDIPVAADLRTIYYTDTSAVDDFEVVSDSVVASDVDSGTVLAYEIVGNTVADNGTTFSITGDYGILTLNKTTGAYSYTPNDTVINALGESTTETFNIKVSDGDGGTVTKALLIDITAVNDGPILGGPKPGDTESDTYGAYTAISYSENSSAVQIDPTITVTDPESKSYDQGSLTIAITSNKESLDQLVINTIGGISVDGLNVKYGSAIIGTIDSNFDGTNGNDLRINLTSDAYSNEVQALMRAISFKSNADSFVETTRELEFNLNDGGNGGTTTPAFSTKDVELVITPINDAPEITFDNTSYEMEKVLGSSTVGSDEAGTLYLTGISIDDVDETGDVTVVITSTDTTAGYGLLTLNTSVSGGVGILDVQNNGTKSITITGTIDEINNTLASSTGLKYVAGNGNDSITPGANNLKITVTDSLSASDLGTKEVIVLPAVPNSYSDNVLLNEDSSAQIDLGNLITDINDNNGYYIFGGSGTVGETIENNDGSITVNSYGSLTKFTTADILTVDLDLNGDGDTDDANESNRQVGYQLDNGTLILENDEVLGSDFANFTFTPNENWNGTEELFYQYVSGDGTISPVSKVLFYVRAVNDAPVITSNDTQSVDEDTSISFNTDNANRIVLSDVDGLTSEEIEITLDVNNGKLNLADTSGIEITEGTSNDAHIKLKGTLANIQNALDNMSYQGNQDYNGSDSLTIEVNDKGNIGTLGNKLIDTKIIDITVNAVNDAPILVSDDNIDNDRLAFGDEYSQDIAYMFSDIETSRENLRFEVTGLPKGLSVVDGKIVGKLASSGKFNITITAYDEGLPVLSAPSKTFTLGVTAPPQPKGEPTTPSNDVNEVAEQIKQDIESNTSTEIVEIEQTNEDTGLGLGENNGIQFGEINDQQQNVENTELTSLTNNNNNNPNDRIVSAGVDLAVGTDGQITFNEESQKSFETVGMAIETIDFSTENVEVKIVDSRVGQKYTVTLADDTPLPNTLKFDPNTGLITGEIPEEIEELELKVSARSTDGTTRELIIKLDVKALKEAQNQNNNEAKFETLSEQINAQNDKMNNYGSFVTSLFSA